CYRAGGLALESGCHNAGTAVGCPYFQHLLRFVPPTVVGNFNEDSWIDTFREDPKLRLDVGFNAGSIKLPAVKPLALRQTKLAASKYAMVAQVGDEAIPRGTGDVGVLGAQGMPLIIFPTVSHVFAFLCLITPDRVISPVLGRSRGIPKPPPAMWR